MRKRNEYNALAAASVLYEAAIKKEYSCVPLGSKITLAVLSMIGRMTQKRPGDFFNKRKQYANYENLEEGLETLTEKCKAAVKFHPLCKLSLKDNNTDRFFGRYDALIEKYGDFIREECAASYDNYISIRKTIPKEREEEIEESKRFWSKVMGSLGEACREEEKFESDFPESKFESLESKFESLIWFL
ncbi:hypothetical protein HYV50_03215 [Candidatus Pacearchaeota archaeon]|nr:hypothetical protein [Candidatus Pacearchaeota archaeon]